MLDTMSLLWLLLLNGTCSSYLLIFGNMVRQD
nr:MAG TPA: hypothetical protein [Caudoviricetes sp.]DAV60195.1 MAG TPA: hypothetical protein [Caudoviricetes sp.]